MKELYYNYICNLVGYSDNYSKLFRFLMDRAFEYYIPMDANRESDGMDLRYQFGYENNIPDPVIASELDCDQCSILEMIIALTIRINNIYSAKDEDAVYIFWSILQNLKLDSQTDDVFDRDYCDDVIDRLLDHRYSWNGNGGMFYISNPPSDMRSVEIWDQAMWWLNELIFNEN